MNEFIYLAVVFFVIALILAVFGPTFGLSGSGMSYKIGLMFLALAILLIFLQVVFGWGFGHSTFS